MRNILSFLILFLAGVNSSWLPLHAESPTPNLPKAGAGKEFNETLQKMLQEGKFIDVLKLADLSLFGENSEKPTPNAAWLNPQSVTVNDFAFILQLRIETLKRLNRSSEIDAFLDKFAETYSSSWRALQAASVSWQTLPPQGFVISGKFYRGYQHRNGQFASSGARDRVRALQLLSQAASLVEKEPNSIDAGIFFLDFANALLQYRNQTCTAWELQDLTNWSELPQIDTENPHSYYGRNRSQVQGTPVNEDGTPLTFALPETFESAKNDGERWRWLLEQAVRVNAGKTLPVHENGKQMFNLEEAFRAEADYRIAQFYQAQFGEQTLQSFWHRFENADEEVKQQGSLLALETLSDAETIARTAAGIKRFTMPEGANYIQLYQKIAKVPGRLQIAAQEQLKIIAENRRQYRRVLELWETQKNMKEIQLPAEFAAKFQYLMPKSDPTQRITENWGRFEQMEVQTTENPMLSIRFRNARKASFTATRVDLDKLFEDLRNKILAESKRGKINARDQKFNLHTYLPNSQVEDFLQGEKKKFLTNEKISWDVELTPDPNHADSSISTPLKVSKPGAYLVEMKMENGNRSLALAWVLDLKLMLKRLNSGTLYVAADTRTGKFIPGAELNFLGFRKEWTSENRNRRSFVQLHTHEFKAVCGSNGEWFSDGEQLRSDYQYMVTVRRPGSESIETFMNDFWFNSYRHDPGTFDRLTAYGVTDRPIYRPTQTVNFKFWTARSLYAAGNYFETVQEQKENGKEKESASVPQLSKLPDGTDLVPAEPPRNLYQYPDGPIWGRQMTLKVLDPNSEEIHEVDLVSDKYGAVSGEFLLPEDAKLGQYSIQLQDSSQEHLGQVNFRMEEYRKPEFEVKVEPPKEPVKLGETAKISVEAKYYFGAPVANGTMKYRVFRNSYRANWYVPRPWDWLYGNGYWWNFCDYAWFPGWYRWGCPAPELPWLRGSSNDEELVLEGEITLTPEMEGKAELTLDTSLAAALYGNSDHQYRIEADVEDASRRQISGKGTILAARQPFRVNVWIARGFMSVGNQIPLNFASRTLDGKAISGKGTVKIFELSYEKDGTPIQKEIQSAEISADAEGFGSYTLKADHPGQFRASCSITSDGENPQTVEGAVIFTVHGDGFTGKDLRFNDLELIPDRAEYQPGETVKLLINANLPDSTVLLFERCENGVCSKPRFIQMKGKSQVVELPIRECDQPNFFIEALVTAKNQVYSVTKEICVPPEKRILNLEVLPSKSKYLPGEKAEVTLKLTDLKGKPFVGQTVVTVYDKSLEYISGGPNVSDIYASFWGWKRHHHPHTQETNRWGILSCPFPGEAWMHDLGHLQLSMNQGGIVWCADLPTSQIFYGSGLRSRKMKSAPMLAEAPMAAPALQGRAMPMAANALGRSRMEMDGAAPASEMADADMVEEAPAEKKLLRENGAADSESHEAKLAEAVVRKNFADTAFWTASLETDENGTAKVQFPMPENLTTWKVCTWAMGGRACVGKAETELITAKNLILRMQTPRFMTTSDEIVLTANVHNYLETEKSVQVTLTLPEDAPCRLLESSPKTVKLTIPPQGEARVDWWVKAENEGKCSVTMSAQTDEESDAMQLSVPVQIHGMVKQEARSGMISADEGKPATAQSDAAGKPESGKLNGESLTASGFMEFTIPEARRPRDSALEVRFSPTLAGAMLDAIPYLAEYPYGCTEQTLNRFLPAVLVRKALDDSGVKLAEIQAQTNNLNAQEMGDPQKRNEQWEMQKWSKDQEPVFDEEKLRDMVSVGVDRLVNMQCSDGGWGWFSGWGESSSAHLTAQVTRGLTLAQRAEVFGELENAQAVANSIQRGLNWLTNYQKRELEKLLLEEKYQEYLKLKAEADAKAKAEGKAQSSSSEEDLPAKFRNKSKKSRASDLDVLVFGTLAEAGCTDSSMTEMGEFIFRDRMHLSPQANALAGIAFFQRGQMEEFQTIMEYLTQFAVEDEENQTLRLSLPPTFCWWFWYGNDIETQAAYLRLLCLEKSPENLNRAARLVKYLLNNRKHAVYWNSTRDTALVLEAFTRYLEVTNELSPNMKVEVFLDGELKKTVQITPENLFTCDTSFLLKGEEVTAGTHRVELRKHGSGPLYFNGYATFFTLEDFISGTGLEVKVDRKYYRLKRIDAVQNAADSKGKLVKQDVLRYERVPMQVGESVTSGDLIEVELSIQSKNDYSYILIEDPKPAGFETENAKSGYDGNSMRAYVEYRDNRTAFFVRHLSEGMHSVSYRLRAETPGKVSALPARVEAMYAPELKANSDEMKIECVDKKAQK